MINITLTCFNCGHHVELDDRLPHNATCEKCSSYLRCCLNCRFYDPNAYNECREFSAERVKEKEKANFCEFFEASSDSHFNSNKRKEEALGKLNSLFKKNTT